MAAGQLMAAESRQPLHRLRGVPVFLYHGLSDSGESVSSERERKYWVSPKEFRRQLRLIAESGYRVTSLREVWSCETSAKPPWPAAVLTFDDGWASDYETAFPLLAEIGAPGVFFVNTSVIGLRGYLTWSRMAEMQKAGMSFQSHSHNHVDLSRLPKTVLERELRDSKRLLEDRLGQAVDFLAVPYGLISDEVVEAALGMSYRAVCNSWSWPSRPNASVVSRIAIYRHTTPRQFHKLLIGDPLCYARRTVRAALLHVPRKVLLHLRPGQLGVRVLGEQA